MSCRGEMTVMAATAVFFKKIEKIIYICLYNNSPKTTATTATAVTAAIYLNNHGNK